MKAKMIISLIGVSGFFPLLLFLFLCLTVYIFKDDIHGRDALFSLKRWPLPHLLWMILIQLIMVASVGIRTLVFIDESWWFFLSDAILFEMLPLLGAMFVLPLIRSGAFRKQYEMLRVHIVITALLSGGVSMLYWIGVELGSFRLLYFLLVLMVEISYILAGVKSGKAWKEASLVFNNLYFLISMFAIFLFWLTYSLLFISENKIFVLAMLPVFMTVSDLMVIYWFSRGERRVLEYNVCNVPVVGKQLDNVLSDPYEGYGACSIRARLCSLFESEKPYLSSDITITEISERLFTNKSYLSKVLNNAMNMNFNEFVNSYRVNEAMRLFIEDNSLSLKQLCEMSGFKHVSSFNNAFKLHTGNTPGEWCRRVKKCGGDAHGLAGKN
jgi:AraC-like DNA-binding protein